jgi:hypothetical protein
VASRIGEVFVSIEADTKMFRSQAIAGVTKALAGLEGKIPVTADTTQARGQIAALKARMTDLNRQLAEVKIGANGKPAEATIRKLQLQLKGLADTVAKIAMDADTRKIDAAIAKERANLAQLREDASGLKIDADAKQALLQIARLEQKAFHLRASLGDPEGLPLDVDRNKAEKELDAVLAQIALLKGYARKIVVGADAKALITAIAVSEGAIDQLKREAADLKLGGKVDLAGLAAAEGQLLGLEEAFKRLNPVVAATNNRLIQGAGAFGRFGIGALTARVALFGGLSAVSGWHIALDTVIETLAVIIPALVTAAAGLAAFGIAGADAARAVFNRLQNIHTVSDALNATIPPMTGNLEKLHNTVRPQVWQLYGDAIAIVGTKTGLFNKLAVDTGAFIDRLAAKITVLATTSGSGLSNFLAAGKRDLQEFGRIAVSLGDAFGRLIRVTQQTGIAEALLSIVGAAARLFDIFTKLPLPILAVVVAVHGIWLWSGLATTALIGLLRPLEQLAATAVGTRLAGTAVKDLAAAGGGTKFAVLGATFRDLGNNLKALPGRVVALAKSFGGLIAANPWIAIGVVAVAALTALYLWLGRGKSAVDRFNESMDRLVAHATPLNLINTLSNALSQTTAKLSNETGKLSGALKTSGGNLAALQIALQASGISNAAQDVQRLAEEHNKLAGQLTLVTGRLAGITHAFGTDGLSGAMALAALAGVKVSDFLGNSKQWTQALTQINGVVQGYANMGVGATQLGSAINVLTIAQSDQLKNVQSLNTAFDTFDKIVAGPVSGFLTFANTLKRFSNDAGVAGAAISGLGTGLTGVSRRVTDASLQLQTDFQDTFNAATQMADAFRLTGTASSQQIAAIKEVVQVMIPMAGTSKVAAAEISALAQEAGGPATTNLQLLSKWAGKTKDPLGAAQKAAAAAAISFSNMSLDAQKLGATLAQDLSKDMAVAVENAVGLQGAMNAYAKSVIHGTQATAAGHGARQTLLKDLADLGIKGPQATAVLDAMDQRLGSKLPAAAHSGSQALVDTANKIVTAGRAANDSTGKIAGMIAKVLGIPKSAAFELLMTGKGSFSLSEINAATGKQKQAAAGWYVTGGTPGKDSVAAMLMPGEVVVPTKMVNAGAVDHLRGMLPGFSGGGLVQAGDRTVLSGQYAVNKYHQFSTTMQASMVSMMRAALKAAEAAAVKAAAAAAASGGVSGAGPTGGDAAANLAIARSMFPWPSSMWPSFNTLEMHEAGYNRFARNPSSGAYGIPQALPPTKMPFAAQAAGGSHAGPQLSWMYAYIAQRYGNPVNAWNQYYAHPGGVGYYGSGGMVPGYAAGGSVASRGSAYLRAWQSKRGGGFGAAWGPVVVNQQIAAMQAAVSRAKALAGAKGLSSGQHKFWAATAADETRRLGVLGSELTVERAWRGQLGVNELGLDKEIRAAGSLKSLAGPVKGWKAQLGRDKATVNAISKMLGYSNAFIAAHPGVTPPPPGPVLPPVTHTYGGDVAGNLGAFISSVAPFMLGGMVNYDRGGWLKPGLTMAYNGTGRNEAVSASGGPTVTFEITPSGNAFDAFLISWLKKNVKVKGGGSVQRAWGSHLQER